MIKSLVALHIELKIKNDSKTSYSNVKVLWICSIYWSFFRDVGYFKKLKTYISKLLCSKILCNL